MSSKLNNEIKESFIRLLQYKEWNIPDENVLKINLQLSKNFKILLDEKMMERKRNMYIFGKAISKVAIFIIILVLLGTITIYAMCYKKFFYKVKDKNTDVGLIADEQITGYDKIESVYQPMYLPSDYSLTDSVREDMVSVSIYTNDEKKMCITQYIISSTVNYDNENTQEIKTEINGIEAICFSKNNEYTLIWTEYGYMFELYITDKISLEEIKSIAESLAPIE